MPTSWCRSIRYGVVRWWTCPMPGLAYDVPVIGGRTMPELLIIAGTMTCALMLGWANEGDAIGRAVSFAAFALMLFAVRMNYLLQQVWNISYERGLLYHKLIGTAMVVLILIHASKQGPSLTGAILGSMMLGAPLVYAFEYFWGKFDWFYYPHVILSLLAIPAAYFHGAPWLSLAIIFWLCDVFVRYVIRGKEVSAKATMIGKDLIRLDVPSQELWPYEAGQYCFLMFSDINRLEYHPFSIASAPSSINNTSTFYIKRNGDWSNRVVDYVQAQLAMNGKMNVKVPMYVEGPYGVLSVDLWNVDVYDTVILIAGGVGITPMTAILPELVYEKYSDQIKTASRRTRRVYVIWAVRDSALLNDVCHRLFLPTLTQHHFTEHTVVQTTEATHLEGSLWTRATKNSSVNTSYGSIVPGTANAGIRGGDIIGIRSTDETHCDAETDSFLRTSASGSHPVNTSTYVTTSVLMGIYYAAQDTPESACVARADCLVHGKRPNLTKIFTQIGHQLTLEATSKRHRVAVAVCGPSPMVKEIRDFCDFHNPHRDTVAFDCHEEVFRF